MTALLGENSVIFVTLQAWGSRTARAWGPAPQPESCDASQIVCRELDRLPQNNTLVPYTDDIMVTGSGEQEVASPSDALVSHIQTRVRAITP